MKLKSVLCHLLVTLASVGIVLPQMAYAVDGANRPVGSPPPAVQDVSLDELGALQGQLVDANGKPVAAAAVHLRHDGRVAHRAATDRMGRFAFADAQAGICEIATDGTSAVYRVWTADSAPPAANGQVLLVDNGDVVRGQAGNLKQICVITGLVIAAGVIGGVIGYNLKDDDDAS